MCVRLKREEGAGGLRDGGGCAVAQSGVWRFGGQTSAFSRCSEHVPFRTSPPARPLGTACSRCPESGPVAVDDHRPRDTRLSEQIRADSDRDSARAQPVEWEHRSDGKSMERGDADSV